VYASANVHPQTGDTTATYRIYRGTTTDGGAMWRWTNLTPDAAEDNIRPFVPRGVRDGTVVLWLRGRYTTYEDYDTDIVARIDPPG
ncbi:MAG: hypothetical protein ACOCUW_03715, partial [Gemmatimonadota bacterium]